MIYKLTITQEDVDDFNNQYFASHPRATKVRIKAPQHPTLNQYMIANNLKGNQLKQDWKNFVSYVVQKTRQNDVHIEKCEVVYTTYFKTNRLHDIDNITPKFIFDGLTACGFLAADDYRHVTKLTTQCAVDRENPRIELEFIEI